MRRLSVQALAAAGGGGASLSTGPVRAVLRAQDHTPVVNRPCIYSVLVIDAVGHPLSFRAVVHTARGSATLTWPVTVAK
jgi:hypothetical protein